MSRSERARNRGAPVALVLLLALLALLGPSLAAAFGAEGHRVVGLVAEASLDARTRIELRAIAGEQSLADLGLWMDLERARLAIERPGSERWHYDNRPVCDPEAKPAAYCGDGQCLARAYARSLAVLGDRGALPEARLEALRIVVHLLADAHQPLHEADHADRGGNAVRVRLGGRGRPRPLHLAWDTDFVKRAGRGESERDFAARLAVLYRADRARVERGDLAAWAAESYELARRVAYGELPGFARDRRPDGVIVLDDDYVRSATRIVEERLAFAGLRLAAVLRAALAPRGA